jgi:hypothetical protein
VNRPFQFYKCSQLFIGTHDKPLSLALGVDDPDRARMMLSGETQPTLNPALDILLTIVSITSTVSDEPGRTVLI